MQRSKVFREDRERKRVRANKLEAIGSEAFSERGSFGLGASTRYLSL
jgi:hypothetical protein